MRAARSDCNLGAPTRRSSAVAGSSASTKPDTQVRNAANQIPDGAQKLLHRQGTRQPFDRGRGWPILLAQAQLRRSFPQHSLACQGILLVSGAHANLGKHSLCPRNSLRRSTPWARFAAGESVTFWADIPRANSIHFYWPRWAMPADSPWYSQLQPVITCRCRQAEAWLGRWRQAHAVERHWHCFIEHFRRGIWDWPRLSPL